MDEQYLDWKEIRNFARQLKKQDLNMVTETAAIMWYRHYSIGMAQSVSYETLISNLEEAGLYVYSDIVHRQLALEIAKNIFIVKIQNNYKLHPRRIDELTEKFQSLTELPPPVILFTHFIDPITISECGSFKLLFTELLREINNAYQHELYDACALLCRRVIETLLISVFENIDQSDEIINSESGRAINLSAMIGKANSGVFFKLDKNTKAALDIICELGNNGAHGLITVRKKHIDVIKDSIDSAVNELLDKAGIHQD